MTLISTIGGEARVRALVDRFYDIMDSDERARGIRALHPPALATSRDKLFWFLVGWMGGPPMYIERFGHPRLRARHLPFTIGDAERDQWMMCMRQALDDLAIGGDARTELDGALQKLADHMRNQ